MTCVDPEHTVMGGGGGVLMDLPDGPIAFRGGSVIYMHFLGNL